MKKLAIALLMLYALLVAFSTQAENVTVSGIVANTGGVPVEIHFTDADSIVNQSVLTDQFGLYSVVVTTDDSSGVLIIYFFDCDSGLVDTIIPYTTGMPPVTFNADYCDSLGTDVCLSQVNIMLDTVTNVYTLAIDSTVQQNAVAYLWQFGSGDSSVEQLPVYTYPQSGTYDVCLTVTEVDGQVCQSCNTVVIDTPGLTLNIVPFQFVTSVFNPTRDKAQLTVYPNPVDNAFTIRFYSDKHSTAFIRLFNAQGAEVKKIKTVATVGGNALVVDANELPAGVYTISVNSGTSYSSSRIVKH